MVKLFIFGLLVSGAIAQFDSFGLPGNAMDMMKDLKPDDIKQALKHMSPEMIDMAKSMGITKDQLKDAAKNIPEDFDISAIMKEKMESRRGDMVNKMMEEVGQMKEQMKEEPVADFKNQMENMGFDLTQGPSSLRRLILPKMRDSMGRDLMYHGINVEDREELHKIVHIELRMLVGAADDTSDEDVRDLLKEHFVREMKQDGMDFDQIKDKTAFKKEMMGQLLGQDMGMFGDDASVQNIIKDIKFRNLGNPRDMIKKFAPMLNLKLDIDV